VDDWFSLEESAKLLRYIYPDYPNIRGPNKVPDLKQFLEELRANKK
jgi:hypothetical protein